MNWRVVSDDPNDGWTETGDRYNRETWAAFLHLRRVDWLWRMAREALDDDPDLTGDVLKGRVMDYVTSNRDNAGTRYDDQALSAMDSAVDHWERVDWRVVVALVEVNR